MSKKYADDGTRLTDCCGSYSSYDEYGQLYCKGCFDLVGPGQGDGSESKPHDPNYGKIAGSGGFSAHSMSPNELADFLNGGSC